MTTTKSSNKNLNDANRAKNDDFYTQRTDIEEEVKHYKPYLKGKTIFCNCDDPNKSEFFRYFTNNFKHFGLEKLITTCYKNENANVFSENKSEKAVSLEYIGERNGGRVPTPEEIGIKQLNGNGDFRSKECIELLKQADIVVTNPPFSLFREYVNQLMEHEKKFLILGNMNAITYKECYPLIQDNKMWLGASLRGRGIEFRVPENYPLDKTSRVDKNGNKFVKMGNVRWFTNLDYEKRHIDLDLYDRYYGHETEYPKYDNYDAINVDRIKDIPKDYKGVMGVPITFVEQWNPDQFEILGNLGSYAPDGYSLSSEIFINGEKIFKRILIKNRRVQLWK